MNAPTRHAGTFGERLHRPSASPTCFPDLEPDADPDAPHRQYHGIGRGVCAGSRRHSNSSEHVGAYWLVSDASPAGFGYPGGHFAEMTCTNAQATGRPGAGRQAAEAVPFRSNGKMARWARALKVERRVGGSVGGGRARWSAGRRLRRARAGAPWTPWCGDQLESWLDGRRASADSSNFFSDSAPPVGRRAPRMRSSFTTAPNRPSVPGHRDRCGGRRAGRNC